MIITGCSAPATNRVEVDPAAAAREEKRQKTIYVRRQVKAQKHIQTLAQPLRVNSVELCGEDIGPYVGFVAVNVYQWPEDYREVARDVLGVDDEMRVGLVVSGSPADEAGLVEGDILLKVAGESVHLGEKGTASTAELIRENLIIAEPTTFVIERAGEPQEIAVIPVAACDYGVALVGSDAVNAFADGKNIYITNGMMRFAETDLELSTVLAHELAHNAMSHIDKKTKNYWLGTIFDVVAAAYGVNTQGAFGAAGAASYSQDFEAEADYIGMYMLAQSGLAVDEAADFWRRMGANHPGAIQTQYNGSHPGTAERYLALEQIADEINAKLAEGLPLEPEFREEQAE